MALSFLKKGGTAASSTASDDEPKKTTPSTSTKTNSAVQKPSGGTVSFLKKGAAAKEAMEAEEARAEAQKAEQGKMFQFYLKNGEDRTITFLDGDLDENGLLAIPVYHEHFLKVGGKPVNYVCTAEVDTSQPCPICERGDSKATMCGLLTVIDHTEHTIQNGPNAGKKIKNTRKIFKAKMKTLKQLTKLATKREGLAGCTVDVSRTGEMEANVGNQFDVTKKWDSWEEFCEKYGLKEEDVAPADYDEEGPTYRSPEELVKLGVGQAFKGIGSPKSGADKKKLSEEL